MISLRMNERLRDAARIGGEAGDELGVNLLTYSGPERKGQLLGHESYHWERREVGRAVSRAVYQPEQDTLCLQSLVDQNWLDKGCVNTRRYSAL